MTPKKDTERKKCSDCPAVIERRVEDAAFREKVLQKMESYDAGIVGLNTSILALSVVVQTNLNSIYFRMGVISGTIGLVTGAISALTAIQVYGK